MLLALPKIVIKLVEVPVVGIHPGRVEKQCG